MSKRIAIYLRVSTKDQTTENQRHELQHVAEHAGWDVIHIFEDAGISGAKGRQHRPAYDALLKAISRREVDLVAAWSVDRLGRSMQDLVAFLEELRGHGVDLYLHQQALDTSTPSGRALFGMMAVVRARHDPRASKRRAGKSKVAGQAFGPADCWPKG